MLVVNISTLVNQGVSRPLQLGALGGIKKPEGGGHIRVCADSAFELGYQKRNLSGVRAKDSNGQEFLRPSEMKID